MKKNNNVLFGMYYINQNLFPIKNTTVYKYYFRFDVDINRRFSL